MPRPLTPEQEAFRKYLETRKVLIADESSSSRTGIFNVMNQLGAKTSNLILANTYNDAKNSILDAKPHMVITEYDLGKKCGLELLQEMRSNKEVNFKEALFVVITGNTSQSAVARAAEEDVDSFIIKPFNADTVRSVIMKAALFKIKPPQYYVTVEEGKALMEKGEFDKAELILRKALSMDKSPALAHYYLGQINFLKKILDSSMGEYRTGLECNRIHYKCLVGLYELLLRLNQPKEAYEVIKRISQYFPANPKRLGEVLRLAIVCAQYDDIEKYHQIFTNMDDRDDTLIRYICAALVVVGKYYLGNQTSRGRALECFKKAASASAGRVAILKEVVLALIDHKLAQDASGFLERFPPAAMQTDDYLLLKFLIVSTAGHVSLSIDQGRALLARGLTDIRLYTSMLKGMAEAKMSEGAISAVLNPAIAKYPDKKAFFEDILKSIPK